jgi:hypothetical protein
MQKANSIDTDGGGFLRGAACCDGEQVELNRMMSFTPRMLAREA